MENRVKNRIWIMNFISILFVVLVISSIYMYSKDWKVVGWFAVFFVLLPTIIILPVRYFVQRWRKTNPEAFAKIFPEAIKFDKDFQTRGNDAVVTANAFSKTSFFKSILRLYKLNFIIMIVSLVAFIIAVVLRYLRII